jgi:hypothetical protein
LSSAMASSIREKERKGLSINRPVGYTDKIELMF